MRSASMGTGDYLCITAHGGAPWGFTLRQGNELHHPFIVCQVDSRGRGALAGLREEDEVVSLNGEPCSDLTLPQCLALLEASDSLQLLVKRRCSVPKPSGPDSEVEYVGQAELNEKVQESTTLEVWSHGGSSTRGPGVEVSESQDEAYYGETESDSEQRGARSAAEAPCRGATGVTVVELQVSLSGGVGGLVADTVAPAVGDSSPDLYSGGLKVESSESLQVRGTLKGDGDLVTPTSSYCLGQTELTLRLPVEGWEGEEQKREEPEAEEERGCVSSDPQKEEEEEKGGSHACVSFRVSAEGVESPEEWDSESEKDVCRPSKHRARHARLRRSESQSEKQVKEAKSKCKRIALLLTATPNPTNKGVLMFKRRRQRAKKFTLVSYGTGETEPEDEEEDCEEGEDDRAVELTLLATSESEFSEDPSANAHGQTLGHNWDTALLEVEKKLETQGDMEHLPATQGKGVLMFAQRRQRVDEIAAEHEEMRQKGIPVDGVPGQVQSIAIPKSPVTQPRQTFKDVNLHQQYQDQQQKQYLQTQQYPQVMNGTAHLPSNESPRLFLPNRTARPFSGIQNRVPVPFSPSGSASPVYPSYKEKFRVAPPPVPANTRLKVWSPIGEVIASRDERISVPAIKVGVLQDTRKRGTTKSALTSKVSPFAPLSLRGDRKNTFESGPEEDFLSLGAEACNFMQTPTIRSKDPPPVAPKPAIDPACPPWASKRTTTSKSPLDLPQSPNPELSSGFAGMPSKPKSPQNAALSPGSPLRTRPQPPQNTWTPPQRQAHPQPPIKTWTPKPQQSPIVTTAPTQTHAPIYRPTKSWNQPQAPARYIASQPMSSSQQTSKPASISAVESPSRSPMSGRGAELFAKRQARMEKFVVDSEAVQANKAKPSSPTPSLPRSWKYSSNARPPSSFIQPSSVPLLPPSCH
ncbi:hypothetical protein GJAV_G00249830 [Gymnothorax javanicus]|nr:hypothetical protein GJAV_G00249830 [Gymnothorax javanicus]